MAKRRRPSLHPRGRKPACVKKPFPPKCPPQRSVGGSESALATAPGTDDDSVVRLHGDHPIELRNAIGIGVTVRGRMDILGVRAWVSGELLLAVDHAIAGPEMLCHMPPPPFVAWTPPKHGNIATIDRAGNDSTLKTGLLEVPSGRRTGFPSDRSCQ